MYFDSGVPELDKIGSYIGIVPNGQQPLSEVIMALLLHSLDFIS